MTASTEDGYRFIRETRSYPTDVYGKVITVSRYALWERQDGRARRVGTVDTYVEAQRFLAG